MHELSPFSATNLARIHAEEMEPRQAASIYHATRLHLIQRGGALPGGDGGHEDAFLVQAMPDRPMKVGEELYDAPEALRELVKESLAAVPEARWSQDGFTVLDSLEDVQLAVTFGARGQVEIFSRHPLVREAGDDLVNVALIEGLVFSLLNIAHGWHSRAGRQVGYWLDLSLAGVADRRGVRGEEGEDGPGPLIDRDHVHLRYQLTAVSEDALENAARPLLHRVRQACGLG